ncbi:MAG: hypothetical protein WC777_02390 [Candidatus Gracilibacteria bacterium]|jgi:D-alanine--D-alanine ligase
MKIALICGGPSLERGISLNSARSVLNHLEGDGVEIVPVYFDHKKRAYHLSPAQLYSNTPSDFDFKLGETAKFLSATALKNLLKSCDLAFPVMHGQFGEDGGIQRILERFKVPFVGAGLQACKLWDKFEANGFLRKNGFFTLPSALLKIHHTDHKKIIEEFFRKNKIKRAVVKPASGGSSIGVYSVSSPEEALEKAKLLFGRRMDTRLVLEPFCEGTEFTVIILENRFNMPVAILPTEIETDYTKNQIFDFRKKYLPTHQVRYHCPPRFDNETIERIQLQAEQIFKIMGHRDFARFDGWLLPDGKIWFSDFNTISGMEQNSFLFQQTARIGFSHRDLLYSIVQHAADRYGLTMPPKKVSAAVQKKPVNVLFGGSTSERQVSLMSGTNAWLKLRRSEKYTPRPYLLDLNGEVWEIPYAFALNHTVEEILENCEKAEEGEKRLRFLEEKVRLRLALREGEASEPFFIPRKMSLQKFIEQSSFVFLGLHGGIGENGTLQAMLADSGVKFNGPSAETSRVCADKAETGHRLMGLEKSGIFVAPKQTALSSGFDGWDDKDFEKYFTELQKNLGSKTLIVKPRDEGCSSGIVRLFTWHDLQQYIHFVLSGETQIPAGSFSKQKDPIEMPLQPIAHLLFEKFIETDTVRVKGNRLKWHRKGGWIEVTVGVLQMEGKIHALSPSLTIAEGEVLSVEEKFQGGTGINLTPPPEKYVKPAVLARVKKSIEKVAQVLKIEGYSRIDAFIQVDTGDLILIEVNTLPGLTPSTVLFHQGIAESPSVYPLELLEKFVENKGY